MTNPVEKPTRTKAHRRSHSQLNDYLHCSWAYRLKRVKHYEERPSVWLAGGKAFHSVSEEFDLATWQENDLSAWADPSAWTAAFTEHFDRNLDETRENNPDESQWRTAGRKTKDKPNGEDIAWWRENGPIFVNNYIQWRTSSADTLAIAAVESRAGVELEVDMPLGGVPMIGYIDRLMVDRKSGDLMVVDLKTGSRTPASPLQLATYSVQIERVVKRPVVWGAFFDARKGVLTDPIDLSTFTADNLGVIYSALDRTVTAGNFLPRIDSHCKACGVREFCVFQGGTETATPQPEEQAA